MSEWQYYSGYYRKRRWLTPTVCFYLDRAFWIIFGFTAGAILT